MTAVPPTLLLPASLVDPQWLGPARVAALGASAGWAALARRAGVTAEAGAPDTPAAPDPGHERWLHRRLALPEDIPVAGCAALADLDTDPDVAAGRRWRLDPVHLHIGRDHLVLTDPASLALAPGDAAALAASIAPLFAEEGLALHVGTGPRWVLREPDPARPLRLATRSMVGAVGRSIDAWQPLGDDARRWRRIVNEVQMTWFEHPVNQRREQAGLPPVNSLWIEGPGPAAAAGAPRNPRLDAAARIAARPPGGCIELDDGDGRLAIDDRLLAAQIAGDPQRWVDAWRALDAERFGPIARAEGDWRAGARIVLAGDAGWRALQVAPRAGWRFWRRRDAAALLIAPPPASGATR
jgi:hypothetical protein